MFDDGSYLEAAATFSPCRTFRYSLTRRWREGNRVACFVMLNPSTADENAEDPTIRRCIRYACTWGYDALVVGNLFALRATDPDALYRAPRLGDDWINDDALVAMARGAALVVAAWGWHGRWRGRGRDVLEMLRAVGPVHYLIRTQSGEPGHPLYLHKDLRPIPYLQVRYHRAAALPDGFVWNRDQCGDCRYFSDTGRPDVPSCVRFDRFVGRYDYARRRRDDPSCFSPTKATP